MDVISVIVPVYNVEKYLERCVDSICKQTYKNLEIILVDDGSPDSCPKMCDEYARKDNRICVIHKENGGLGFARNSGLEIASGKYITFVDSDDWIHNEHIENLYKSISEDDSDLAIGLYTKVASDGKEEAYVSPLKPGVYKDQEVVNMILLPWIGSELEYPKDIKIEYCCWKNLYRRDLIDKYNVRFESEKYAAGEDLYFNIDYIYHATKVVSVEEKGYYYFVNNNSISRKYDSKRFERTLNCYKVLQERVEKYGLQEVAKYRCERTFLTKLRSAIQLIVFSDMSYTVKTKEIRAILRNKVVQKVLAIYPIDTYVLGIRLFSKMMKRKNVLGVYWLMWIREFSKRKGYLKFLTKKFGFTV